MICLPELDVFLLDNNGDVWNEAHDHRPQEMTKIGELGPFTNLEELYNQVSCLFNLLLRVVLVYIQAVEGDVEQVRAQGVDVVENLVGYLELDPLRS